MRKIVFSCLLGLFFLAGCSITPNVSVQQMREKAKFETYTFSINPPWTTQSQITNISFFGDNTFINAYRANDGRHVVLTQSNTYRKKLGPKIRKGQLIYTSPNGFNVWVGGPKKCYCASMLQSAQHFIKDPPADDCMGYALESPTGAVLILAVNGPLADKELHNLVDSLIPAKKYLKE
jgi:hypothetical protein